MEIIILLVLLCLLPVLPFLLAYVLFQLLATVVAITLEVGKVLFDTTFEVLQWGVDTVVALDKWAGSKVTAYAASRGPKAPHGGADFKRIAGNIHIRNGAEYAPRNKREK